MRITRIAVDFDGTIVYHEYPDIGDWVPGALKWLRDWTQDSRVELCLWTMRSDSETDGPKLSQAIDHCMRSGIGFYCVNSTDNDTWTTSPKLYAHLYIDDSAVGCPLRHSAHIHRPYVDWSFVGPYCQSIIESRAIGDDSIPDLVIDHASRAPNAPYAEVGAAWNEMAAEHGLPLIQDWNARRKQALKLRVCNPFWASHWRKALALVPNDPFRLGGNSRGWVATIDWFLRPNVVADICEKLTVKSGVHTHGAQVPF